ncbi:hypothetical protein K525DRAFT_283180 [Schizophyllum commune Loenen D]|nr:hypothetical protein K525DRAFT_283180 [Schizophyllum commune Loenen D]
MISNRISGRSALSGGESLPPYLWRYSLNRKHYDLSNDFSEILRNARQAVYAQSPGSCSEAVQQAYPTRSLLRRALRLARCFYISHWDPLHRRLARSGRVLLRLSVLPSNCDRICPAIYTTKELLRPSELDGGYSSALLRTCDQLDDASCAQVGVPTVHEQATPAYAREWVRLVRQCQRFSVDAVFHGRPACIYHADPRERRDDEGCVGVEDRGRAYRLVRRCSPGRIRGCLHRRIRWEL